MYNTRYHIASLVAVFLALALGLVLGGLVVRQGTFDSQQQALVSGLRSEFKTLSTENKTLKERNDLYSSFSAAMTDGWASSRLAGKSVVVVVGAGNTGGLSSIREAVESAGGQTVIVTLAKPGFALSDAGVAATLPNLTGSDAEKMQAVAASLTAEWSTPTQDRPLTAALVNAKALTVEGLTPGMAVAGLVDYATFGKVADEAGLDLVQAFADKEIPALAAQKSGSPNGLAKAAADRRLAAVDTVGLEPGRYSIVALLSGATSGFYGTGDGVDAAFPPLPGTSIQPAK